MPRGSAERVSAWRPAVPGIAEVFHARFVEHVYPAHTHAAWTLIIVDEGAIRYDLERREHGAARSHVTLLPPHVAHTGRAGTTVGFRKRVLYLDTTVINEALVGSAVATPSLLDDRLFRRISELHDVLRHDWESLEAESRLAFIRARILQHLRAVGSIAAVPAHPRRLAHEMRDLLDSRVTTGLTLRDAGVILHSHPDHLVRAFTTCFGLPPHRYLTGRRIDAARRLLLEGGRPADVATAVGFYDQAHMSRHFVAQLGVPPGRYTTAAPIS